MPNFPVATIFDNLVISELEFTLDFTRSKEGTITDPDYLAVRKEQIAKFVLAYNAWVDPLLHSNIEPHLRLSLDTQRND